MVAMITVVISVNYQLITAITPSNNSATQSIFPYPIVIFTKGHFNNMGDLLGNHNTTDHDSKNIPGLKLVNVQNIW
jgi:hypothetical protein